MTTMRSAIRTAALLALLAAPAQAVEPATAAPVDSVLEVSAFAAAPVAPRGPLHLVNAALGLPVPDKPTAPEPAAAPAVVPLPAPTPVAPVKIYKEELVPEDVAEGEGPGVSQERTNTLDGRSVVLLEEVIQDRAPPQEQIITAPPVKVQPEPEPDPRAVTDPLLNLTMDRSEVLRLPRPASSVLVGNPAHIGVLVDDARTLIVVPRAPGATFLTVLDEEKNVIVQRHVVVAAPGEQYVRVRKTCVGDAAGCEPVKAYYCPGMCHEIEIAEPKSSNAGMPPKEADSNAVVLPTETIGEFE